ncbi:SRPBCC domain-containing protein [Halalkalicoccus salilacus]|uniref:SRPBCC domain-containing protein n=1 Tax=Halalkalicoccus salilacus TaxID=3117459 RepID=UPI00300F5967
MREIRTEIEIDAPPEAVWEVLADIDSYDEWNPHLPHVSGDLREGESIEITVDRIGERRQTMTVRVSTVEPVKRLQWIGTVGSKWVFEGRHTFDLYSLDEGRTRLINHERVSGFLTPFVLSDEPQRDYDRMNHALKERAERRT